MYHGLNGFAGELGHMTIEKDENHAVVAILVAGNVMHQTSLIDEALNRGLIDEGQSEPFEQLIQLQMKAITCDQLFNEIATYIAISLTNCINI